MLPIRLPKPSTLLLLALGALYLGGCTTAPPPRPPEAVPAEPQARPGKQNFHVVLEGQFDFDYQVETKLSSVDGKSCYGFITGSLTNRSDRPLSRQSVLDIIVRHKGEMLFRDLTNPRADIPPGGSAMINMVDSPVHRKSCPTYDQIEVNLRKVYLP